MNEFLLPSLIVTLAMMPSASSHSRPFAAFTTGSRPFVTLATFMSDAANGGPVDRHGRRDLAAVADTRSVRPQARDLQLETEAVFSANRNGVALN